MPRTTIPLQSILRAKQRIVPFIQPTPLVRSPYLSDCTGADVWLKLEPLPRGGGFEFVNQVPADQVPGEFVSSVERGARGASENGPLAGYPVTDVKVTLLGGSFHEVDSSKIAFEIAGSMAFADAVKDCNPTLLEPIMKVQVIAPTEYVGRVMGDLNTRRAHIHHVESRINGESVDLEVPLAEMFKYATHIRSLTQGRGIHTMEFSRYDEVPANIVDQIVSIRKMYGLVR